jgi:glycerophosphoryl diester phosphodiesterase
MKKFGIVNLSNYVTPEIKEVRNKLWVQYGADNAYYQYLIDRYNGSPTNNAIINGLSEQIFGKGLNATDSSRKPDEYAQMISLFKKDVVRKFCYDLKLMGQCAIQVIYSKDRNKIAQIEHLPIETIRAEKVDETSGDIEAFYYSPDWLNLKPNEQPKRIPAFGTSKESIEILCVKPYRAGFYYYSPVDYQGGLQYAELEEEIANYHLNNIKNGLAPSMLINFNNGIPNEEERELIEKRIYDKFSGSSSAGKFILAFNDNTESSANLEPVQLSDAHNQYQFLSDESSKKILVSHRIVSPMLFGIKDNTGLGNNAEELKTASILNDNVVVKPFQDLLIDAFDKILAVNAISLNMYFETLQPLEFTQEGVENVEDKEVVEEETGVKMSKHFQASAEVGNALIELGEEEDLDNWELVDEREVDYDQEETLDKMIGLASTGVARPNSKSEQDKTVDNKKFKVRYQYAPLEFDEQTREFCRKMVQAKKLYRKEDIMKMKDVPVNAGWGPEGADTYDIWLYKGGGSCRHFWMRKTYMSSTGTPDVGNPNAEVSVNEAKKSGLKPVKNNPKVAKRTRDQKNRGFLKPKDFTTKQDKAFD